jgi:hypothetical protein
MESPYRIETAPGPLTVSGRRLSRPMHVCAFFDSAAQEDACVAPYVAEGLDNGEQVFAVRAAAECLPYVKRLAASIARTFDTEVATGQLRLRATEETYLAPPGFEADRMIEILVHVIDESREAGFKGLRTCGDMGWALRGLRDTDELMEYEARVNLLAHAHECSFMCVYDLNRFGGRAVMDVLSTHPMVVMGDRIYENPYYVEPREFLERLLRRDAGGIAFRTH